MINKYNSKTNVNNIKKTQNKQQNNLIKYKIV